MKPGRRLGHYEIVRELGAGAMGEVVLAQDTRLGRQVALKSLPDAFADDAERLARFEREARMLAALHHPPVASLFGFEELEGRRYLVMEYVEGETLAQRIARGAVDLGETAKLAEQIARGLAAAHDKGIIHRDLKPGNVLVTPGGQAKVVDFGLAKDVARAAVEDSGLLSGVSGEADDVTRITSERWSAPPGEVDGNRAAGDLGGDPAGDPAGDPGDDPGDELSLAATVMAGSTVAAAAGPLATEPGVVLGTAAYMSPEQARGQAVDRRCDVWAFGCVVFEMLTRRRPFEGENMMQTLSAVLQKEPPWEALPAHTPPFLDRLLRRCLRKDPDERLRDLGDAALVLHDFRSGRLRSPTPRQETTRSAERRLRWLVMMLSGVVALGLGLLVWTQLRTEAHSPETVRFRLHTPDLDWGDVLTCNLAVSPDGRTWVYRRSGTEGAVLMLWRIDETDPVPIPGTEGGSNPFWSPDGRHLGFVRGREMLRLEPFQGSPRTLLTQDGEGWLGRPSWGEDGTILYATLPPRVLRIPAAGGEPEVLLDIADHPGWNVLAWPEHIDGTDSFAVLATGDSPEEHRLALVSPDGESHRIRRLGDIASSARFLAPDELIFVRAGQLLLQKVHLEEAALQGDPIVLAERVAWHERTGAAGFDVAPGLIVSAARETRARLQWFDARDGTPLEVLAEAGEFSRPRISAQGDRVAVGRARVSGGEEDLWVFELERNTGTRLTSSSADETRPVWSPDGSQLAYYSDAASSPDVMIRRSDAGGEGTLLVGGNDVVVTPGDWSPDGLMVLYWDYPEADLYLAPVDGSPSIAWLLAPGGQREGRFSPDGRWIAFTSTEVGSAQIFVAPIADSGRRQRVSVDGGRRPVWSPAGDEIYFHTDHQVRAATFDSASGQVVGEPRTVLHLPSPDRIAAFDIAPDGSTFLVNVLDEALMDTQTLVQVGWRNDLVDLVETR